MIQLCTVFLVVFSLSFNVADSAYVLQQNYSGSDFFSGFTFFTAGDPTHGFVNYVNQSYAEKQKYIQMQGDAWYIGTDTKNVVSKGARGRDSVRISSKTSYQLGLFIIDLLHMPTGCATWPAWWLVGPAWPNNGEVDIIEGVNVHTTDATSLHTSTGSDMKGQDPSKFTGYWSKDLKGGNSTNCFIHAPNQNNNAGCGIIGPPYGAPFNAAKGGVYALEWTNDYLQAFYFARNSIPGDIYSASPDPSSWGSPYAYFGLGANCPTSHFQGQQIVLNLALCGDWAAAVFGADCPGLGDCKTYVANNPAKFTEAYWLINFIAVFSSKK